MIAFLCTGRVEVCQNQVAFVLLILYCESLTVWKWRTTQITNYSNSKMNAFLYHFLSVRIWPIVICSSYSGLALMLRLQFHISLYLLLQTACLHECSCCWVVSMIASLLSLRELRNIVVIVTNSMFILPSVQQHTLASFSATFVCTYIVQVLRWIHTFCVE